MNTITYTKQIPVRYDVDVFVAGGGPAGLAAAVTAARQGKKVFVAEAHTAFGGAAVTMLVPAYMQFTDGEHFLAGGIGQEIYDEIKKRVSDAQAPYCPTSIPVEVLKRIGDDMADEAGVDYCFNTNVIDAAVNGGAIEYVVCAAKDANGESVYAVRAKVYIDCTGDGDLAVFCGAETEYGDENGNVMATTLCGIWGGIDWSKKQGPDSKCLEQAFEKHYFTNEDRHLPGIWRLAKLGNGDGIGGSNAGHIYGINGGDARSTTKGIVAGRRQLPEYRAYYRDFIDGFENFELLYSATQLGIRESRRIVCDYRLVLDDFLGKAVFEDEIGRYSYPVDIHSPTNDKAGYEKFAKEHGGYRYQKGESYGIPYRVLPVKGLSNLLTAGRCVCTDRYMQSSIRVMPGCYITGQAAGMAAALCSDGTDVHSCDVHELQKRLVAMGGYLPNFR